MINRDFTIMIIALSICFHAHLCFGYGLEAKVTAKVVNEDGAPMSGEEIYIGFEGPGGGGEGSKGFTDANGHYTATGRSIRGISFSVMKSGYYNTYSEYEFRQWDYKNDRLLPWNPEVTLVLRKIKHPVAMYAHKFGLNIPVLGKDVGFDLMEYDWVAPYGKGKQSDFIFRVDQTFVDRYDFDCTLTLTFSNKFDGIQLIKEDLKYGSRLKLPRNAPKNGYQNKLIKHNKSLRSKPYEEDYKEDNSYIFRVRSEEKDGKLIKAMYGKIQSDVRVGPDNATAYISFKYYLNPDYTTNLEYDPNQNLFLDLRDSRKLDWVGLE